MTKYRFGFVSNSSSSSFIVRFSRRPETIEELAKMMGDCYPICSWGSSRITSEEVVANVWRQIQSGDADVDVVQSEYNYEIGEILSYRGYDLQEDTDHAEYYRLYAVFDRCIQGAVKEIESKSIDVLSLIYRDRAKAWYMEDGRRNLWARYMFEHADNIARNSQGYYFNRDRCMNGKKQVEDHIYYDVILCHLHIAECMISGIEYATHLVDAMPEPVYVTHGEEYVAYFSYSDNEGEFNSNMEHGNIFRNVDHLRINNH
jgi:hypothetical protein